MSTFVIILDDAGHRDSIEQALREINLKTYPHHSDPNVLLVKGDTTPEQITQAARIKHEDENLARPGAVLKLNGTFAGYTSGSLWDFME